MRPRTREAVFVLVDQIGERTFRSTRASMPEQGRSPIFGYAHASRVDSPLRGVLRVLPARVLGVDVIPDRLPECQRPRCDCAASTSSAAMVASRCSIESTPCNEPAGRDRPLSCLGEGEQVDRAETHVTASTFFGIEHLLMGRRRPRAQRACVTHRPPSCNPSSCYGLRSSNVDRCGLRKPVNGGFQRGFWITVDNGGCRSGGWGGIRTHGGREPTPVFKTGALNRSATHPS